MTVAQFAKRFGSPPAERLIDGEVILCPKCEKEEAIVDSMYGIMDGEKCKKMSEEENIAGMGSYPEFLPQYMHSQRKDYAADQIQSHRGGELSREFIELHPERVKGMVDAGVVTKEEVKKSKYVWREPELKGWESKKKIDVESIV